MKKIVLTFLLISLFIPQFAGSGELSPSIEERELVYANFISNMYEQTTRSGLAFRGSSYSWIRPTTILSQPYFVSILCGNELDESYERSRVGIALPYSYQFVETGTWDSQKIWSVEFKRTDFPYTKNWMFGVAFSHEYDYGAEVMFFCYIDNYRYA